MKKYAVIIKHPYRSFDFRVDIVSVPENTNLSVLKQKIESEMLGPFEVIAITDKIDFDRKVTLISPYQLIN